MESHERIVPKRFIEENKGKLVSTSKRRYTWEFEHDSHEHTLDLEMSLLTRKFTILFDGNFIVRGTRSLFASFEWEAKIHDLSFAIVERLMSFDLFINKHLFPKEHIGKPNGDRMSHMNHEHQTQAQKTLVAKMTTNKKKDLSLKTNLKQSPRPEEDQSYLRMDRVTSPVPDSPHKLEPLTYRRLTTAEKPLDFSPSCASKRQIGHRTSLPPQADLSEQFLTTETKRTADDDKSDTDRIFVVRRLKITQLSEYEIQTEKYEGIDFASVTGQQRGFLKLLYPTDKCT
jgi:hypothetical protein